MQYGAPRTTGYTNMSGYRGNNGGGGFRGGYGGGRGGGAQNFRGVSSTPLVHHECQSWPEDQPRDCPGCGLPAVPRMKQDGTGAYWTCPRQETGTGKSTPCEGCGWLGRALLVQPQPVSIPAQRPDENFQQQLNSRVVGAVLGAIHEMARANVVVAPPRIVQVQDQVQMSEEPQEQMQQKPPAQKQEDPINLLVKSLQAIADAAAAYFAEGAKRRKLQRVPQSPAEPASEEDEKKCRN